MRKIGFFLLILLFPIASSKAYYCKYSEISKYKSLASNISTSYDYNQKGDDVTFSITLNNLDKNLYIVDTTSNKTYWYTKDEIVITNYAPGSIVKYNVYANNEYCNEDLLYTIRVNLPSYNKYYNDAICNGIEDYALCQRWYGHNYDYNTFISKVENYKKSLIKEEKPEIIVENKSYLDLIIEWLLKYYYIILILIILISTISIIRINKKNNIYS